MFETLQKQSRQTRRTLSCRDSAFLIEFVHIMADHMSEQENGFHFDNILRVKMI